MATDANDNDDSDSDVEVEPVSVDAEKAQEIVLPPRDPGEYYSTTDSATASMKGTVRHIFEPTGSDQPGYDAMCGNKNAPKGLSGKALEKFDDVELLLGQHRICTSCANKSGIRNAVKMEEVVEAYKMYDPSEINVSTGKQNIRMMFGVEIPPGDPRGAKMVDSLTAFLDALETLVTMKTPVGEDAYTVPDDDEE